MVSVPTNQLIKYIVPALEVLEICLQKKKYNNID